MVNKCKTGFRKLKGKCVKIKKGVFRGSRKSNNPFKLWGSYVGAILFMSPFFLIGNIFGGNTNISLEADFFGLLLFILGAGIIGFLIGWGIQLLIRRFR